MVLTKVMISCYFGIPKLNDNRRNKRPIYRLNASLNSNKALIKIMGWLNMHDKVMTIVLIVYVLFY